MNTDPSPSICIARQPLVNSNLDLVGFELLFRPTAETTRGSVDDEFATSSVIATAFTDIGIDRVLGNVDGYLNVDSEFLFSDLIESLPRDRIVLELMETTIADDRVLDRVATLRSQGYRVAIDNFVGNFDALDTLLPLVDIVKIDFETLDPVLVPVIVDMLRQHNVRLIASKVETRTQFAQAKGLGIGLFQGFHFAHPEMMRGKGMRSSQLGLIRLLSLAMGDADTMTIETELRRYPDLAVHVLRLSNSVALGSRQKVTSLRHALVLLGRRQLGIWLQLLLYTADQGAKPFGNPLLQMAAVRGKLMNLIAREHLALASTLEDVAFMTGILSLMDVVTEVPMEVLVKELNVVEVIRAALMERSGEVGQMLNAVEALERNDAGGLRAAAAALPRLNVASIAPLQVEAFRWATEITAVPA